jgi:hypothetical protein
MSIDKDLIKLILPEGILDFFTVQQIEITSGEICIHLQENNIIPSEYSKEKLESKGFLDPIKVKDFPIRGKAVYLSIKRRRWYNESTGQIVSRNWDYVAKGTRITKEFAAFLKAIARY